MKLTSIQTYRILRVYREEKGGITAMRGAEVGKGGEYEGKER